MQQRSQKMKTRKPETVGKKPSKNPIKISAEN